MITLSWIESVYLNKAARHVPGTAAAQLTFESWYELATTIETLSSEPIASKSEAPLISPATFSENIRSNELVEGWHYLAFDIDNGSTIENMIWLLEKDLKLNYILYTTASHTPEKHKFRLLIQTDSWVPAHNCSSLWLGTNELLGRVCDPQCKDLSRCYYIPMNGADVYYRHTLNAINTASLIKHGAELLPKPLQKINIKPTFRMNIQWAGVSTCPFVRQEWIDEYLSYSNGSDQHYKGIFKFMLRVAGYAHAKMFKISAEELASLALELDRMKDSRWSKSNRPLIREANNAIKIIGA